MLTTKIQDDLKTAMIARDEVKVSTLRLLISEIKNATISKGGELSDEDTVLIIQKEVKKRVEAAAGYRAGGREETAVKEEAEAEVLKAYLPDQISDEELTKLVQESINEVGAKSVSDMGRVIGLVMGRIKGRAEGSRVSAAVKSLLGS